MVTLTMLLGAKLLNGSKSSEINTDELNLKTVGLYFSGQWCSRCRSLTSKLGQAYRDALNKNINLLFDIVFISADSDQESFDEYYQNMPWKALPFENRDQAEQLNNNYQIQDIPSLIIIKPDGEILTLNGDEEFSSVDTIEKWAKGETLFWTREPQDSNEHVWVHHSCHACYMKPLVGTRFGCANGECDYYLCRECYSKQKNTHQHELIEFWSPKQIYSIEQMFTKSEVIDKNSERVTIKSLENKYIGLYFFARWSMSSTNFTSTLAEVYRKAIEFNLPFDIVFISGDDNQVAFDKVYEDMPWKALSFDNHITQLQLKTCFSVSVIPTLIIIKPTGELLTKSGVKDIKNKEIEAIQTWCKGEKVRIQPEEFVWSSIICDGCDMMPLIGPRFYCELCSNYDLCWACKQQGHEHELVLMIQPDNNEEN